MAVSYSTNFCFDTTIGFLVTQDHVEVCPLSRGVMLPKGSTPIQPLQAGLFFLRHPLPAVPLVHLTARFPSPFLSPSPV